MLPYRSFLFCIFLTFTIRSLASPSISQIRAVKPACGTEVNITNPILKFLDYSAMRDAAHAAVEYIAALNASRNSQLDHALQCDRIRVR